MPRIAKKNDNISIIIPCAGFSDEIKNHQMPKALIGLSDTATIISRQIEIYKKLYPTADLIVVAGYGIEQMMNYLPRYTRVIENPDFENTGVLRSIALGLMACNTRAALISYGDLVFTKETVKNMFTNQSKIIVYPEIERSSGEFGVNETEDGNIRYLAYGLPKTWAQIAYLNGVELERFKKECYGQLGKNRLVSEALNGVVSRGGNIVACSPKRMKVIDVDNTKTLVEAKKLDYEHRV